MKLCWFFRRLSAFDLVVDGAVARWRQGHHRVCGACRQQYDAEAAMVRQLIAEAGASAQVAPSFLPGKIMAAIAREGRAVRNRRRGSRGAWASAAAAGILVMLGAALFLTQPARRPPVAQNQPRNALFTNGWLSAEVSLPNGDRLAEISHALDSTLEQEVQSVLGDATNVAQSLARSFLPAGTRLSP